MNFKSTYPPNWKDSNKGRVSEDSYTKLNTQRTDLGSTRPGFVTVSKSIDPIGLVNVFSEEKEVIKEYRRPNKMATLGEMKAIWTNFNQELYNSVINYYNAQ